MGNINTSEFNITRNPMDLGHRVQNQTFLELLREGRERREKDAVDAVDTKDTQDAADLERPSPPVEASGDSDDTAVGGAEDEGLELPDLDAEIDDFDVDADFDATGFFGEIEDLEETEPVWAELDSSITMPGGMIDPAPETRAPFEPSIIFDDQSPTLENERRMISAEDAVVGNPLFMGADTLDTAPVDALDSSIEVGAAGNAPIYPAVGSRLTGPTGSILRTELQNIIQRGIGNRNSLNAADFQNVFGMSSLAAGNIMREQGRALTVSELVARFAGLEGLPNRVPDSAIDAGLLALMGPGGPTGNFFDFANDGALGIDEFANLVNEALTMAGRTETPQRVRQLFGELAGDGGTFGRTTVLDGIGAMEVWPDVFEDDGFFHLSTLGDLLAVQFDNLPRQAQPRVTPPPSVTRSMRSYTQEANLTRLGIQPSTNVRFENEQTAPRASFTDFLQFASTHYNAAGFGQPEVSTAFRAFQGIGGIDGRAGYSQLDHRTAFGNNPTSWDVVRTTEAWGSSRPTNRILDNSWMFGWGS